MTRVRHRQSTCEEQCQNWRETLACEATLDACEAWSGARALEVHGNGWRVRVAPPGACGLHRRNEIRAGVDSIVSRENRLEARRSLVRRAPLKLDRPIVRVPPGVSRYRA